MPPSFTPFHRVSIRRRQGIKLYNRSSSNCIHLSHLSPSLKLVWSEETVYLQKERFLLPKHKIKPPVGISRRLISKKKQRLNWKMSISFSEKATRAIKETCTSTKMRIIPSSKRSSQTNSLIHINNRIKRMWSINGPTRNTKLNSDSVNLFT